MKQFKHLCMLLAATLLSISAWGTDPVTIYLNEGAVGITNGITASGNVNTKNGNTAPSFGCTSSSNTTFTFSGFDVSNYESLVLTLDVNFSSFPSTTEVYPKVTVTFTKDEVSVLADATSITVATKTTGFNTYTIDNIPDFDKIVLVVSPAEGKTAKGAASILYSTYIDNITVSGVEKESGSEETTPSLESIAVSGNPTKKVYEAGDAFDPAGLVVTGTYSEGDPKPITEGITWAVTPETLTEGLTSVSVVATVSGVSSEATTISGLTVNAPAPTASFIFNTDAGLSALGITKPASSAGTNLGEAAYTSGVITMTATNGSTATRVWNSSGTTDLRIYANGGTLTFTGATITKIELAGSTVNGFTANVGTYATNTWSGSAASVTLTATGTEKINTITVSYVAGSAAETVATPVLPAEGAFVGSKSIELSCETDGASIYYTLDGTDPTSASTMYNGAFTLTETATVKAIAVKDGMLNSAVVSATYTKVVTLNSMDEIFAAATTAGSTAASKVITFDNWVISGVKGNNAYLTDNNGKGLIIYQSGHGFVVGDVLSGTVTCDVLLYNGSAELKSLTSTTIGLTVTKGGSVTPITSASIADLGGVNTGAIYSFSGLTYNGTAFSDGENTITPYNTFITLPTLITGKEYNVKGMYLQYNTTKEIAPRTAEDIEEAASDVTLTSIAISGTATKTAYFVGDAFDKAGLTVTATYSDASTLDVTSSAEWSYDPAALDNTSITTVNVTATFNEVSSEAYPVAVTVAELPVWATTYTSNVTLTAQSDTKCNKEKVKVNGEETQYDALKMGTSSVAGSCEVTVPLGTTKLHFHAILWNGTSGSLVVKQAETELFNQAIAANTGLANSSPYTLADDPVEDYYCIDFGTPLTEATTLTFSCTNKRFAIYGVNAETAEVELLSITVSGTPSQLEYYEGQALATAGLVVTGTYNIGDPRVVSEGIEWTVSPATLAMGNTSVTVTATVGEVVSASYVVNDVVVKSLGELGDAIIIVFPYDNKYYAMKSDLSVAEVSLINGKVLGVAEAERLDYTWYKNESAGKATFVNIDGNYLTGSSSTTLTVAAASYEWTAEESHYVADGAARSFLIQSSNGNLVVKNYATSNIGSSNFSGYPIFATEFLDGEIESVRTISSSNIGTICLEKEVVEFSGATFYEIAYKEMVGEYPYKIFFDQVDHLEAGKAYIFEPEADATEIKVVYGSNEAVTPVAAADNNGLQGTFEAIAAAEENVLTGKYLVSQNRIRLCGANCSLADHRAYIVMKDVSGEETAAPVAARRISLGTQATDMATDLESLSGEENVTKIMVDGVLFVLRHGQMYDATGRLVK